MTIRLQEKKEFERNLNTINVNRGLMSALLLSAVVPLAMIFINVFELYDEYRVAMNAGCITMELIQLAFTALFVVAIKSRNIDIYKTLYIVYFALTLLMCMYFSVFDMIAMQSQLGYIFACGYLVFVPIFDIKTRRGFCIGQAVVMLGMMIIMHNNIRCVVDMAVLQTAAVLLARYQHNSAVRIERTTANLKKKTITSEHDALTGLLNRRALEKRAEAIWPYCQRKQTMVGIITLDIDYFKKYNDKFGHPQGDVCLRTVAKALIESAIRNTDIIIRTGGEEFLIFVQDTSKKELVSLALKIRKNIESKAIPHAYCAVSKNVTVSMGIASTIPSADSTFDKLYEEADRALYLAKENGRNCIVCDSNLYGRIRNGMAQVISM